MKQVQKGDKVTVHYTGKLTSGEVFDSSVGRSPLFFTVGAGQMIKGFDYGVLGLKEGEKKTINIPFLEGYGAVDKKLIFEFPIKNFPSDLEPKLGLEVNLTNQHGQNYVCRIIEINADNVLMDANHFLAGKDLIFEVELVSINDN